MKKIIIAIIFSLLLFSTIQLINVKGDIVKSKVPIIINFPVQALTSSPTDSQTVYFGIQPKAPSTTASICKQEININGNITGAYIYCYSGTAGTNENWVMYIRLNNLVDYVIATVGTATNERIWEKWDFNIPVVKGDYFEIKGVQPLWATNPLITIYGGYVEVTNISTKEIEVVKETTEGIFSIENSQFYLLILLSLWIIFIMLYEKNKEVIYSFCIICFGLPLGIIISGISYYNSYPFGYLISFILILISFLIPSYSMYNKNKNKKK